MTTRLRQLRGKRSQSQVEIRTGVKQRTLSGWENDPPEYFRHLIELAKYYQVSADYILGLSDDPRPRGGEARGAEDGQQVVLAMRDGADYEVVAALLGVVEELPGDYQALLLTMAQSMALFARRRQVWTQEQLLNLVERMFGEDALNELLDELGAPSDAGGGAEAEDAAEDEGQ